MVRTARKRATKVLARWAVAIQVTCSLLPVASAYLLGSEPTFTSFSQHFILFVVLASTSVASGLAIWYIGTAKTLLGGMIINALSIIVLAAITDRVVSSVTVMLGVAFLLELAVLLGSLSDIDRYRQNVS